MTIEAILADTTLLRWLFFASVVMFVAMLVIVPLIIVRLPADYFAREQRARAWLRHYPAPLWLALVLAKNALAVLCLLAGIAMLVLPGQGLLTIFVGILLLDFPGKYAAERWLISRPRLRRLFDRVRALGGKPPFEL